MKLLIIIDAGHGYNTAGKRSPDSRLMEWKWNRDFAYMLQSKLKEKGISAQMLVPEDYDVSLSNRCLRANTAAKKYKAVGYDSLVISVHVNAAGENKWSKACGWSCYTYTKASQKSRKFASIIGKKAEEMGLTGDRWIPESFYHEANFYILKNTDSPAVLCENMFMTNKEDVDFLLSTQGMEKLAYLYINSILDYIAHYNYTI